MSLALGSARNVEQLARPLLELLELVTDMESTYFTRIDLEACVQTVVFSRNSKIIQIPEGLSVPWDDTLCKRALEEGTGYTDDVAACWGDSEAARALGLQTYASTPVYLDDGRLYGTLCAASSAKKPPAPEGAQVLKLFSSLLAVYIQREILLQQLQETNAVLAADSFTDTLTRLPNRRFVQAETQRLFALGRRTGQRILTAFVDLDGFKQINDRFGHDVGDAFLIEVGKRLSSGLRAGDVLARLGGDEFVVVGLTAPDETNGTAAAAMRRRLAPLLQGRFALKQYVFDYPGASFGVVVADPHASTPEDALREADAVMYAEKKARAARFSLSDSAVA